MGTETVKCPTCSTLLSVPTVTVQTRVRCGQCQTPFLLQPVKLALEDTVANWLDDGQKTEEESQTSTAVAAGGAAATTAVRRPLKVSDTPADKGERVRMVSLERRGALFEFSTSRLLEEDFRCAIPRMCAHCLSRTHLSAHLVIYASELRDSVSLEVEHDAGQLVFREDRLGQVSGAELLARLPKVPNVPEPGNLPMPYWVCDLCKGVGDISGQIQVNTTTGRGICRLFIRNLELAAGFLAAAGAAESPAGQELEEFLQRLQEDRWDALPVVVRHRVEQWYRPKGEERFLAYIPDHSRPSSEDGMVGLVVSTTRLVYHHSRVHEEFPRSVALKLQVQYSGGSEVVTIDSPGHKRRSMPMDRGGVRLLRRSLAKGRFQAAWQ